MNITIALKIFEVVHAQSFESHKRVLLVKNRKK